MATYLLTYHGGTQPAPEDAQKVMDAWMAWFGRLGESVVDGGNPVSRAASIASNGTVGDAPESWVSGYSLLKADSFEQAIELAKSCPHLQAGGSVEVGETFNIPM